MILDENGVNNSFKNVRFIKNAIRFETDKRALILTENPFLLRGPFFYGN